MDESERINTGMRLTRQTIRLLDEAAERIGRSRATVVELLALRHAGKIVGDTPIPATFGVPGSRARRKNSKKSAG